MKIEVTRYVKRDGSLLWLRRGFPTLAGDELISVKLLIEAGDGKEIVLNGKAVGNECCIDDTEDVKICEIDKTEVKK